MSLKALCEIADKTNAIELRVLKMNNNQFMVVISPSEEIVKVYPQLASPLQIVETADKIDAAVAFAIQEYVPVLVEHVSNMDAIKKQMKDAEVAAKEAAKAKTPKPTPAAKTATTAAMPPSTAAARPPMLAPDLFASSTTIASQELDGGDQADNGDGEAA
jgi:PRTRC genetic system protein E